MCCVHSESEVTFCNAALFIAPAYIHVVGLWLMVAALAQLLVRRKNVFTVAKWEQTHELIMGGVKGVAVHILKTLNFIKLYLILHIVSKTADVSCNAHTKVKISLANNLKKQLRPDEMLPATKPAFLPCREKSLCESEQRGQGVEIRFSSRNFAM